MGYLFIFEGPDGVGKSTLVDLLTQRLRDLELECGAFAFPGNENGTVGRLVHELHHSPQDFDVGDISPSSLQLLHVAAHVDTVERRLLPAYDADKVVLLDRFWWSTWVYGHTYGVPDDQLEQMIAVEKLSWRGVLPSMVFLVDRPGVANEDLVRAYELLMQREQGKYPAVVLGNGGAIDAAVEDALATITDALPVSAPMRKARRAPGPDKPKRDLVRGSKGKAALVFSKLDPATPSKVYDTYWRFATERQAIFFRQVRGSSQHLTRDPILMRHKFTNAYRASDRVSQFLIHRVIYQGDQDPREIFFRTILFKLFNRIDTWLLLEDVLGTISYAEYGFDRYDAALSRALASGARIYSAAYIMPTARAFGTDERKHRTHLRLLEKMMKDDAPMRLIDARTMRHGFELLRSYPMLGDFLAYQFITDLNYSQILNFSETEFVVPGPGARDGLRKCFASFGGLNEADLIRLVAERQEFEFDRLALRFESLWGRSLQLIDCQNLFCEVDKYARLAHPDVQGITGRTKIKQFYRPSYDPIDYWYPPKWGLNELVRDYQKTHAARRGQG